MILIPNFVGIHECGKKTCILVMDGENTSSVINLLQPTLVENLSGHLLSEGVDDYRNKYIQVPNSLLTDDVYCRKIIMKNLDEFNVIVYSESIETLEKMVTNDIFGTKALGVGIGTTLNIDWGIPEWQDWVKNIQKSKIENGRTLQPGLVADLCSRLRMSFLCFWR